MLTVQASHTLAQENTAPTFRTYQTIPNNPPKPKTLRFATLEWPPYISSALPDNGYMAQLLREIFLPAGYSVEIMYLPWQRAVHSLNHADIAGYFPEYFDETIQDKSCIFSESIPGGPLAFVHKTGRTYYYKKLVDLQHHHFGVVSGYINFKEFDEADYLTKDYAPDDLTNIRKLLADRISIIIGDPLVINYLYNTRITPGGKQLEVMHPYLEEKSLYLCFNPKYKDAQAINTVFSTYLAKLKNSGRLKELHDTLINTYMPNSTQ